jgi:transposase
LPLDNNRSEGALRKAALGRKNFLFVGHQLAGDNLAGLYSLVATCEVNGLNPELYLADVLLRVQTHPNSQIDELLPHLWQPLRDADSSCPDSAPASLPTRPTQTRDHRRARYRSVLKPQLHVPDRTDTER